jgi:hypothetical protein
MADPYGKRYFSWVQCSLLCIPDPTRKPATGTWQLALSKSTIWPALIRVSPLVSAVRVFSAPPCLRGEQASEVRL